MPYKDPAKKAEWEREHQNDRSARRGEQRGIARASKPERQSYYASWVTFLRRLPVEVVTGSIPFNPNARAIVPAPSPAIVPESEEQTLAWWYFQKDSSTWRTILHKKEWYGCATGSLAKSLPPPTDISKELQREQEQKHAILKEAECEEEYRCSELRIEMRVGLTGELILYGDTLKEAEAEVARNEDLIRYFEAREEKRLREKASRKPRKLLEEEWRVLELLECALQPTIRGPFRLERFREQLELPFDLRPLLERMQERGFLERLAADTCEELELKQRVLRIAATLHT